MKKTLLGILVAVALSAQAWAVAAPTNVAAGTYDVQREFVTLSWDNNAAADQWFIYLNGNLRWSPIRSQVGGLATNKVAYVLPVAATAFPITITMTVRVPGSPISAASTPLVITSASPVQATYMISPPGTAILVSGTVGSSGTSGVSITSSPAIETATTTQAFWTQTPVAYNLSTTAGVPGKKYIVTFQPNFGGAGVFVDFATLTYTSAINAGYGSYLPTTLTGGVAYGPYVAGFHAIVKSSTATGVSGVVRVEAVP